MQMHVLVRKLVLTNLFNLSIDCWVLLKASSLLPALLLSLYIIQSTSHSNTFQTEALKTHNLYGHTNAFEMRSIYQVKYDP